MSIYIDILVDTSESFDTFVREVETLLSLTFTREVHDAEDISYIFEDSEKSLWIYESEYANDLNLSLAAYRYAIGVEAFPPAAEDTEKALFTLAQDIFETLRLTSRYRLLMVRNLQHKLAQFDPVS